MTKTVSSPEVSPGQPFTYTITVNCSEASCLDATLDDALPAELAGYPIQNVSMQPAAGVIPREVTWTVDGAPSATAPAVATADTALHVDFTGAVTAPAGTGLQNGQTFTVTITLQVPDSVPPGEQTITNTAFTAATNSEFDDASATITVVVPEIIDVDVSKAWSPSPQSFNPGSPSTIDLSVVNASNGPVETLVLQEPADAEDGASELAASNPFSITDFTGFSGSALPDGATAVQVDAYVLQPDDTWAWQAGTPSGSPALPLGVDPGDVGGIRLTYTGTAIAEAASGDISLALAQRATDRDSGADLSTASHTVNNVVEGTAVVEGREPVTDTATASYTVNPASLAVATTKDIAPDRIAAGDSAEARITATNTSDVGVNELRIADLDYFTEEITFGGFTAAPTWPADAASAVLVYYPLDGGAPIEVPYVQDTVPAPPGEPISGFEFVFTATGGAIESAASTVIDFTIQTTEDAVGAAPELPTSNQVDSRVTAPNGLDAEGSDTAPLVLLAPAVEVTLEKTVRPSSPVAPGETVVTELAANLTTTSDYVTPTQIVVEDAWTGNGGFWDAFDLASIAPTQVPSNTAVTIQVRDGDGTWIDLQVFPAQGAPFLIALSGAQIQAALPGGVDITDLTGIRFIFDNPGGFAADTTVTPYVVSSARDELRSGGTTVPGPDQPVTYENVATTTGEGETQIGTPLTDTDEGVGEAIIESQDGTGPVGIDKQWNQPTVPAQSQAQRSTTLSWRVSPGFEEVSISDPVNPQSPQDSVFEAFDLVGVNPIAASAEPFSNGWYLRYDRITAVELYSAGAWQPVAEPAGGWIQSGAFVGYTLTPDERADVTGVRIQLEENTPAREAAAQAGPAYDPFAPMAGTGVATSSASRTFVLTWQIRDQMRPSGEWVTDAESYNTADEGVVDNTAGIDASPIGGGPLTSDTDNDTILITNPGPGVTVTKTATPTTPLYVPIEGAAPGAYPTATFTLLARNDSVARASYVRVMDPPACTDVEAIAACQSAGTAAGAVGDPFTGGIDWLTAAGQGNPFDRFDLTGVTIAASIPAQVDLGVSTVWLLRYAGGLYSTEQSTAAAVNAMDPSQLADVVGISVTFQGSDPEVTGGTITSANALTVALDAQLRTHLRTTGDPQTLAANQRVTVPNRVFAQSYDPILSDGQTTGAQDDAAVTLTGGDINVDPVKSISPTALTEPTRDDPVTVTLGANQGTSPVSTLAPAEVRLTDDVTSSPDFWNQFDFTGLGTITPPAGADQIEVAVYGPFGAGGELAWVESAPTPIAGATVPVAADQYSDIEGIQFTFSRADGQFFSPLVPAPTWSTTAVFTVQLRDQYRDSGEDVVLSGEVDNTVTVISDRLNGESSEAKAAAASIALSEGTFQLAVNKLANDGNHFTSPGTSVPWDLTFTNTGTGYLTITELRDLLPPELVYLGTDDPVYTSDPGGLLPDPESLTQEGAELIFTWPENAQMAPGETFGIRILLELQPGLSTGEQAINEITVHTVENLASCTNTIPGGSTTGAWAADDTTCGTTDYVTPSAGPNLFTVKGVRGALDGAANPAAPAQVCAQSLDATGGSYYRAPCAANSVIGGTDDWVLRTLNAGTTSVDEMIIFDQFPVAGDQSLISGASRGSVYRPQLLDNLVLTAPGGTTSIIEVTTSSGVCVGTWSNLQNQEPCAQNGEVWTVADGTTDWAVVSGVRVRLDFRTTPAGALTPGQFVDITYSTLNLPASTDDPDGAPSDVPATDSYAWNQFGVKFLNTGATAFSKISPSTVGVHLVFGAMQIDKAITGPAAGYAADEFLVDVACAIEGVDLDMGEHAVVELSSGNALTQRIDGIPLGAECTITEQGETGAFGETSRSGTPATLAIDTPTVVGAEVPAAQIAEITNDYQFSGLSVTKFVQTEATEGDFGPFDFTISCTSSTGLPVTFAGGTTELAFTLSDGGTFTAPAGTIPAGAECLVTEVDSAAANDIVVVGTGVTDNGDGSAQVEVGVLPGEVEFTNSYDSGILTVVKLVDGEGADLYGTGPFTFTATCAYGGQELLTSEFQLEADSQRTFGPLPTSTTCVVEETGAGGATSVAIDPEDGTVLITEDADELSTVTATNTFDITSMLVTKTVEGDLTVPGASGPFLTELQCVLPVDGADRAIDIPGGAERELRSPDSLTASYEQLPVGALCTLDETETQDAFRTSIVVTQTGAGVTATDGTSVAIDLADMNEPTEVRITNVFVAVLSATGSVGSALVWVGIVLLLGGMTVLMIRRTRRA